MDSVKFSGFIVCISVAAFAAVVAGDKGGVSVELGSNCMVVASTVKNCSGATGTSCSNSTALLALVKSGNTSVLVCNGKPTAPKNRTIAIKLGVESCERCTCFTAPLTETRSCAVLQSTASFPKKSCSDLANLKTILAAGTSARVCVINRNGMVTKDAVANLTASLDD